MPEIPRIERAARTILFIQGGGKNAHREDRKLVSYLKEHLGADYVIKNVPTFFYQGTDDRTVPVVHLQLYAKAFPHSITRMLEGRDHQLDDQLPNWLPISRSCVLRCKNAVNVNS